MIPLAALAFARTWWKAIPGAVVGAALAFPLGHCSGARDAKAAFRAAQAEAALKAEVRNAAANEAAAVQRAADADHTHRTQEELSRADDAAPDSRPSDARRAYLCARLRDQAARGGPAIPESCRPDR